MRIIAGTLGGRRLRAPRGSATRPTADRVRESLFSILGPLDGARVLDLYAGTGALGLEALSRGAATATFVDRAAEAVRCIQDNARALEVGDRVRVLRGDAVTLVARLDPPFDLVFADPPYAAGEQTRLLAALPPVLTPSARLVLEHDRRAEPPELAGPLALQDRRRYGDTALSFYGFALPSGGA